MNTPVNFEIAKLLKEKGFDEPTHSFYVIDESEYGEIGEFITNPNDNYPTLDDNSLFDTLASAPTIAEVVMWLYEKHKIWIWVEYYETDNKFIPQIPKANLLRVLGFYESPTEAYSAAIEYTLKNLIK